MKQSERLDRLLSHLRGTPAKIVDPSLSVDDSAFPIITEVFLNGNCGNLVLAMKYAFPEAVLLYSRSQCHAVIRLDNRLFDIRGDVTSLFKNVKDFEIYTSEDIRNECIVNNYSFELRGPML